MKPLTTVMVALALIAGGCSDKKKASTGNKAKSMKGMGTQKGPENDDGEVCDAESEGLGFCFDDSVIVFCTGGSWYELDCSELGASCSEDSGTVDCFPIDEGETSSVTRSTRVRSAADQLRRSVQSSRALAR